MSLALRPSVIVLAALLAAPGAYADDPPRQSLYRIVGPDGKVTFSDRRPTDTQAQTRELGKLQQRPLFTPGLPLFETPQQAAATARRVRTPPADGLSPPVSRTGQPLAPGLPDAILIVTGHRFFVQVLLESCGRDAPAGLPRYQVAVRNWRDRNVSVFARADQVIFSQFSGEQRDQLRYTAQARLQAQLPRPGASADEIRAWCDSAAMDLSRRQHELAEDPRIAPMLLP